jgi:protein-disulfide isomerase
MWGGVGVVVLAVIAVVAIVSTSGGDSSESDTDLLVNGGQLIGDPAAPVTIVEFADFQ